MKWLKLALVLIGFLAFCAVVIFALPLVGFGEAHPFEPVWVQALLIGLLALILLIWGTVKLLRRRKGQAALEQALIKDAPPTGDGRELASRMQAALATLKKSGNSKTYLYDMPWYVIIGPPGSGKTTALVNSEIKFPISGQKQGGLQGFGGTRYCDWWFAEEAILIDTAGRYTTQDSDAGADAASWSSFLNLLKRNRPKQPINGVIIAISVADLMNAEPEKVSAHAETIRARLGEIHETLKVDFPVYVMFTKADLIAGFREYFASFSVSRRKKVWGATFQTTNRKEETVDRVGAEYDALVARLSDEVIDRLSEEADGVNRIAIFGLPGQMAMLKDEVESFLRQVFEPTRYKTNAILRGFYFTSGTQEGTPIDQVLGAMSRSFGGQPEGLLSGKGKSFFLHDLLANVVFGEQGWVSYDRSAVRRSSFLRIAVLSLMLAGSAGLLAVWAFSYLNNRAMIADAQAAMTIYETDATEDLQTDQVKDTDLTRVANELQELRAMPSGYDSAARDDSDWSLGFGLSQQGAIRQAARDAYGQALERMFRPRLVLRVEQQLRQFVHDNDALKTYDTLKVYMLLGGLAPAPQDDWVKLWFKNDWENFDYKGPSQKATRDLLQAHLAAMLELDDTVSPSVSLDADLVAKAQTILALLPLADRAYSLIVASAQSAGLDDFNLLDRTGTSAKQVFETLDGADLATQVVPGLYTYDGFNAFFMPTLAAVAKVLKNEQWVLGKEAEAANVDDQMSHLGPQLLIRYSNDFIAAWENMLQNLRLAPMAADKPVYAALGAAASPTLSPILKLVEAVDAETQLTQPRAGEEGDAATTAAAQAEGVANAAGKAGDRIVNSIESQASGLEQIGIEMMVEGGKTQMRAGPGGGTQPLEQGANIAAQFDDYHQQMQGEPGTRPIDKFLGNLAAVQQGLVAAAQFNQAEAAAQIPTLLGQLKSAASQLPPDLARMVSAATQDLQGDAASASIAEINDQLTSQVLPLCQSVVDGNYPFFGGAKQQTPLAEFARLFAPDGVLDKFFAANLAVHADMSGEEWTWRAQSPLADKLSLQSLRQFQRAKAIRDAFFPGTSQTVSVEMMVIQSQAYDRIKQSELVVDGAEPIVMRKVGNSAVPLVWPGPGIGGTTVALKPPLNDGNRANQLAYRGPWAFLQFIRDGKPRQIGDVMQVDYDIGGRSISYQIKMTSGTNPFNLPELSEFRCPTGM